MNRRQFLQTAALSGAACIGGKTAQAQNERPNILLILCDDMGYSDIGCYGGEIDTPNLDRLAENGLRFTNFYNAARCCPTRASLLTGLYPHQAGMGEMVRPKRDLASADAYQGYLEEDTATLAEVLGAAGYSTYMAGKWHVGENPPDWPTQRGFDQYYGLISGACNYFDPRLTKAPNQERHFAHNGEAIMPGPENFYTTDAFTDHALEMLGQHDASKPFFLYLAYNAPHWPLHAHEKDIKKYLGRYKAGWSNLRRARYRRMIGMGIIDPKHALSPQDPETADWDALDDAQREEMDRKMAVYAAQIDSMDQNIGRVLKQLEEKGQLDNTLVLFLSDNGACHETGPLGRNFRPDLDGPIGSVNSYHSYGRSWSNAGNTPFRLHKHWTHEGGIATPLIVHWPQGIKARGELRRQVGHIIDIMPTLVDAAGATYPKEREGRKIPPMEGQALQPFFEEDGNDSRTLYWEHFNNRAIRDGRWKLVAERNGDWALYDMEADRTELQNLIEQKPEKAAELAEKWERWARRIGVRNPEELAELEGN